MMAFNMAIIKTYVHVGNWTMVTNYYQKANEIPDAKDDKCYSSKLQAAAGLASLANRKYSQVCTAHCAAYIQLDKTECSHILVRVVLDFR